MAFAVNFGVAPLLFVQVLYGHLFYTSSILVAVFRLAVIPLLIVAYYALYLHGFRFGVLVGERGGGMDSRLKSIVEYQPDARSSSPNPIRNGMKWSALSRRLSSCLISGTRSAAAI